MYNDIFSTYDTDTRINTSRNFRTYHVLSGAPSVDLLHEKRTISPDEWNLSKNPILLPLNDAGTPTLKIPRHSTESSGKGTKIVDTNRVGT